jgi:hypothetical protein
MKEEIEGFSIPFRELTEEESLRVITLYRFNNFHAEVGEDFVDQISSVNTIDVAVLFAGFAMAKHPEWSLELLECVNNNPYTQLVQDVYRDFSNQSDDLFYTDFAEFLNQTVDLRKDVNQILIQVAEYYN